MLDKTAEKRKNIVSFILVFLFLALVLVLDQVIKPTSKWSMLLTVLQKG